MLGLLLGLIHQDFLDGLAGQVGDFAFQVTDPRFAGVIADHVAKGGIGNLPFVLFQPVFFDLLRNQVPVGDFDLFVLGVAGQANDLHPVQQRRRHGQGIGGGDEKHVRKVVVDLKIMIVEGVVLFRVQNLQQRRGGVAAPVMAHLVHLVQQEQRVG